jgi:hypothetical protein
VRARRSTAHGGEDAVDLVLWVSFARVSQAVRVGTRVRGGGRDNVVCERVTLWIFWRLGELVAQEGRYRASRQGERLGQTGNGIWARKNLAGPKSEGHAATYRPAGHVSWRLGGVGKGDVDEEAGRGEPVAVDLGDGEGQRVLLGLREWCYVGYFVSRHGGKLCQLTSIITE